jgi:hypothetical protein
VDQEIVYEDAADLVGVALEQKVFRVSRQCHQFIWCMNSVESERHLMQEWYITCLGI